MLSLAGSVLVKGSFVETLAAQVQYPVCSCLVLENLTEQSLLLFPNAGNCRTGSGWVVGVAVVEIDEISVAEIIDRPERAAPINIQRVIAEITDGNNPRYLAWKDKPIVCKDGRVDT